MKSIFGEQLVVIIVATGIFLMARAVTAFEAEEYEEPAGLCFAVHANPSSGNWEFGFEDGTWLRNTPVMGQAYLVALRLDKTESWYGGIGMILRIVPRWNVAPFVGAGGGYYHSWASTDAGTRVPDPDRIEPESFWGGLVEAGVRMGLPSGQHFLDLSIRHLWNSADSRLDTWMAGLAYGQAW